MEKIIIHNYIKNISKAFIVAEMAYDLYLKSSEGLDGKVGKFVFGDITATVRPNNKSCTITIKATNYFEE